MNRLTNTIYKQKVQDYAFKVQHEYPHLEAIEIGTQYAITVSPADRKSSYLEFRDIMIDILNDFKGQYKVYPEISTENQNWHVHGYIIFKDQFEIMNFYLNIAQLKSKCSFKIRTIDTGDFIDAIQWYMYCKKQKHIIKPWIHKTYDGHLPYSFYKQKI